MGLLRKIKRLGRKEISLRLALLLVFREGGILGGLEKTTLLKKAQYSQKFPIRVTNEGMGRGYSDKGTCKLLWLIAGLSSFAGAVIHL